MYRYTFLTNFNIALMAQMVDQRIVEINAHVLKADDLNLT